MRAPSDGTPTAPVEIRPQRGNSPGFSLIELVVVVSLIGLVASMGMPRFMAALSRPTNVDRSSRELVGNLRLARILAISRYAHYRIAVTSASGYEIQRLTFDAPTGRWVDQRTDVRPVRLPPTVVFTGAPNPVGTTAEFDTRGFLVQPTSAVTLNLEDTTVRIAGGVRTLPSGQIARVVGVVY